MRRNLCVVVILSLLFPAEMMAWTIGAKSRSTGPTFHTTYFLTPLNQAFRIKAVAFVGSIINGSCQIQAYYEIGSEVLRTGDFVNLDAFALKNTVGGGYQCLVIDYQLRQQARESLQLFWDGVNYIGSSPPTSEVTLA